MKVRVINCDGKPVSSTTGWTAKLLLKQGKARLVERNPLTIQLLYTMNLGGF